MSKLSLVIPTYNESKNIPILLSRIDECLAQVDKEVIVVDDNSLDRTWEVVRSLEETYPWLRLIRRVHDRGLSSAVLAGFAIAEGDYLAVMDADLQHDERILPEIFQALEKGVGIVVASRKVEGGGTQNWNVIRRMISWVATVMAKMVLRREVTDPMSGFFALRREIYQAHRDEINPRGFKILLEFLAKAKGSSIQEIGYTFRGRIHGESKLSGKVIFDYIRALYDLSIGIYIPFRFLKYVCVGFSGLIVSYISLLFALKILLLTNNIALYFSIEISILSNFVFNNYWTFKENRLRSIFSFVRGAITFNAICLGGALINHGIALKLFHDFDLNLYFGNAVGYVIAAIWNYAVNVGITWKQNKYQSD